MIVALFFFLIDHQSEFQFHHLDVKSTFLTAFLWVNRQGNCARDVASTLADLTGNQIDRESKRMNDSFSLSEVKEGRYFVLLLSWRNKYELFT